MCAHTINNYVPRGMTIFINHVLINEPHRTMKDKGCSSAPRCLSSHGFTLLPALQDAAGIGDAVDKSKCPQPSERHM